MPAMGQPKKQNHRSNLTKKYINYHYQTALLVLTHTSNRLVEKEGETVTNQNAVKRKSVKRNT